MAQDSIMDKFVANATVYRNISIDGLNIFYREAGPKDGPTLLLLHGFPSSSRRFDPLLPLLSGAIIWSRPTHSGARSRPDVQHPSPTLVTKLRTASA